MSENSPEHHSLDALIQQPADFGSSDPSFDTESMFLTRKQATVLSLRERGIDQGTIADHLDCSRANVSNLERSARTNIEKARQTIAFADIVAAPVHIEIPAGFSLHEIPERVFTACDDSGVKVNHGAPELIRTVTEGFPEAESTGAIPTDIVIIVTASGNVRVLQAD